MNSIHTALFLTRETIMIFPLIVFCFIPVYSQITVSLLSLIKKVVLVTFLVEIVMFIFFLLLPFWISNTVNAFLCIFIFFYFYERTVALPRSHLWFIFMSACLLGSFAYLFYYIIDILLYPHSTVLPYSPLTVLMIEQFFEWILFFLLAYPAKRYLGWLVNSFHEEKIWKIIWIPPALFVFFSQYLVPENSDKIYVDKTLEIYLLAIAMSVSLIMIVYLLFFQIAHIVIEKQKVTEKNLYLQIEAEQTRKLQAFINDTSRLRHDYRHHLATLNQMLEENKYAEAKEYLKEFSSAIPATPKRYCSFVGVNSILNHYETQCKDLFIKTHFSIRLDIPENTFKETDFCVLLGNLLDNSIAACRVLPKDERHISLKFARTNPATLALQIRNPYYGNIKIKNNVFYSTKHEGTGQGLYSVQLIAEKYNGIMNVNYENQTFEVRILLTLPTTFS